MAISHLPYLLGKRVYSCQKHPHISKWNTIMQESKEHQLKNSLVLKNKEKWFLLVVAHIYFPLHLRSPIDLISIWFVFRTGEEKSWIWQVPSLEPTLTRAVLLVQIIIESSNASSPRETSVPNFSLIPQGSSLCKRLWPFLSFLSFCLLESILWIGTFAGFSPPSSPRCFWFSGCTPVKLGRLGKCLSFIYSREECDLHIQMFKMVILFSGINCKTC